MGSGEDIISVTASHPNMTTRDPIRDAPRQHRRLNPFLRKPLWLILERECGGVNPHRSTLDDGCGWNDNDDDASSSSGVKIPQLINHIEDGDRAEEFDFEYRDHGGDDRSDDAGASSAENAPRPRHPPSPSSSPPPSRSPPRHLTLFDLVSIGVGGTIGSGIFVINGLIAHSHAGPATFLSWIVSGAAAMLSGCCYAELSGRIPAVGSSYAYAFVALGELPAFVTAGLLTLEFLLSGSAVAR
jgi:hypothetical protein